MQTHRGHGKGRTLCGEIGLGTIQDQTSHEATGLPRGPTSPPRMDTQFDFTTGSSEVAQCAGQHHEVTRADHALLLVHTLLTEPGLQCRTWLCWQGPPLQAKYALLAGPKPCTKVPEVVEGTAHTAAQKASQGLPHLPLTGFPYVFGVKGFSHPLPTLEVLVCTVAG